MVDQLGQVKAYHSLKQSLFEYEVIILMTGFDLRREED